MDKLNYYEVLGVPKTSSSEEIKQAYKKLALVLSYYKYPRNGIPIKIQTIKKWQKKSSKRSFMPIQVFLLNNILVLSDTKKRANYDKFGNAEEEEDPFDYDQFMQYYNFDSMMGMMMGDMFQSFLGGMFKKGRGGKRGVKIPTTFMFKQQQQ